MSEIVFYSLQSLSHDIVDRKLADIIELYYKSNFKTLVVTQDEKSMHIIDDYLWSYSTKFFLPHDLRSRSKVAPVIIDCWHKDFFVLDDIDILIIFDSEKTDEFLNIDFIKLKKCLYIFDKTKDSTKDAARYVWSNLKKVNNIKIYHHQL